MSDLLDRFKKIDHTTTYGNWAALRICSYTMRRSTSGNWSKKADQDATFSQSWRPLAVAAPCF